MVAHEKALLEFLRGEEKDTCTNEKIVDWQYEQIHTIVKGTVYRMDMQGVG